jgi:hypothetical protein
LTTIQELLQKFTTKLLQIFFRNLHEKGVFVERESEQLYDEIENQFLADRYVEGECPKCGFGEAYGDQCESCGSSLNATDLINPKSKLSGNKPVLKKTKHWFLPLNNFEPFLKKWFLKDNKDNWKANVFGQVKSWINEGLKPRAITRDLDWGIPVPLDEAKNKVLYVWFDAPIGYISATKEWAMSNNKDWEPYWKDSKTQLVHFLGKDNIVFHCIIFPSMLKATDEYILPVYGSKQGKINSQTIPSPDTINGKEILKTEKLFNNKNNTIIRFGGLINETRNPLNYLIKKSEVLNSDAPINYIHLEDCIGIILSVIKKNKWGEIYLGVAPFHPTKKNYFDNLCEKKRIKKLNFSSLKTLINKEINDEKIYKDLNYKFEIPQSLI